MDKDLRALQRQAKQGDAEDRARYVATLVKTGRLSRRAVQLAAMFVETPEAALLEPDDYNRLGTDADIHAKAFAVAQEASYAGIDISELCRQLLLWLPSGFAFGLPEEIVTRLRANKKYKPDPDDWQEYRNVADRMLGWQQDLVIRWGFPTVANHELLHFANIIRSMSYHYHITPQLVSNFILYGNVEGP